MNLTDRLVRDGGHHYFCFCEGNLLVNLVEDQALAQVLRTADAVFPDGISLSALVRLQGRPAPVRISGPGFLLSACAYGVSRGWRHYFYGGEPGVVEALAARLRRDFPGIAIVGAYSPPFRPLTPKEELETKDMIESARPHLLWVGLGGPKQEKWCAHHVGKIDVPLMLPIGAAIDFHSGRRPWAPAWVRRAGLEWAFRALTGGPRMLRRNVKGVSLVLVYLGRVALTRLLRRSRAV